MLVVLVYPGIRMHWTRKIFLGEVFIFSFFCYAFDQCDYTFKWSQPKTNQNPFFCLLAFILIERRHLNIEFKKKKNWMPSFSEGQTLSDKSLSHFAALPISALILSAKIDQWSPPPHHLTKTSVVMLTAYPWVEFRSQHQCLLLCIFVCLLENVNLPNKIETRTRLALA